MIIIISCSRLRAKCDGETTGLDHYHSGPRGLKAILTLFRF